MSCPRGVACTKSGISAEDGYYVYFSRDQSLQSIQCLSGYCKTCSGGAFAGSALTAMGVNGSAPDLGVAPGVVLSCCTENRPEAKQNPLCGACVQPDYFVWGESCVYCTEANVPAVFGLLVLAWLYVTVFHVLAQRHSADTRIFINFTQFVYIFTSTIAGGATAWLALFNFNVFQTTGGTCIAPFTDMQRLAAGLFVPVVSFAFLCINCVVHAILWKCYSAGWCQYFLCVPSTDDSTTGESCGYSVMRAAIGCNVSGPFGGVFDTYRRTALAFLCSSYTSVVSTVMSFFSCTSFETNRYISLFPSVDCEHDPAYLALRPLFGVMMVACLALPLVLFFRLLHLRKSGALALGDIKLVYGPLLDGYTPDRFYWECWVLVRRLIIAVVAMLAYADDSKQRFTWLCFFVSHAFHLVFDVCCVCFASLMLMRCDHFRSVLCCVCGLCMPIHRMLCFYRFISYSNRIY